MGGLTYALGLDHSSRGKHWKWPAFQLGEQLMLHYWMTGDPDSYDAAIANADYIRRNIPGLYSVGVREQTRPMVTLWRAWQATGDERYHRAARKYFDLTQMRKRLIEWRRGAYILPFYENLRVVSAGLDAMYAQAAYEFYRMTGDLDAAQLVVAIADSVYAESMLPQEEGIGDFLFYPRYPRAATYYAQMVILFHIAYDLTGDKRFLRAGRAALERYLLMGVEGSGYQSVENFGYLDPEAGGWELEHRRVQTEPYMVGGQTTKPDPSAFAD